MQLGFAKAHHKMTPIGKVSVALGYGGLPKLWGSPLILLQRLRLATSNFARRWSLSRRIIKSHPEEKLTWAWAKGVPQIL